MIVCGNKKTHRLIYEGIPQTHIPKQRWDPMTAPQSTLQGLLAPLRPDQLLPWGLGVPPGDVTGVSRMVTASGEKSRW